MTVKGYNPFSRDGDQLRIGELERLAKRVETLDRIAVGGPLGSLQTSAGPNSAIEAIETPLVQILGLLKIAFAAPLPSQPAQFNAFIYWGTLWRIRNNTDPASAIELDSGFNADGSTRKVWIFSPCAMEIDNGTIYPVIPSGGQYTGTIPGDSAPTSASLYMACTNRAPRIATIGQASPSGPGLGSAPVICEGTVARIVANRNFPLASDLPSMGQEVAGGLSVWLWNYNGIALTAGQFCTAIDTGVQGYYLVPGGLAYALRNIYAIVSVLGTFTGVRCHYGNIIVFAPSTGQSNIPLTIAPLAGDYDTSSFVPGGGPAGGIALAQGYYQIYGSVTLSGSGTGFVTLTLNLGGHVETFVIGSAAFPANLTYSFSYAVGGGGLPLSVSFLNSSTGTCTMGTGTLHVLKIG